MNVGDLINALGDYDDDDEVKIVTPIGDVDITEVTHDGVATVGIGIA